MSLLLILACSGSPEPETVLVEAAAPVEQSGEVIPQGPTVGEKNPPIPADNPAWKDDRPGFRPNFFFYGERSWADVRMRVVGQIAMVERDRARLAAMSGEPKRAGAIYHQLAQRLRTVDLSGSPVASGMRDQLVLAAERDGRLLQGVGSGSIPEDLRVLSGTLFGLRAQLLHWSLAVAHRPGPEETRAWVVAHKALVTSRPDLKLDGFVDFDDRHKLRDRLLEAYLDSVDPIGFSDPWGYWEDREILRQSEALLRVAEMVAPLKAEGKRLKGEIPSLKAVGWWQRTSVVAAHLVAPGTSQGFTVGGLGRLPTGDSLIDVAGEPGPMAIGKLERLGLDDSAHAEWLRLESVALNQSLTIDPSTVPGRLRKTTETLDAHGHGSRYYNIKAARNEAVRMLARRHEFLVAREVLITNRPLHHQDWACPNRDGILLAIEGRLLASAGDSRAARVLGEARQAAEDFLAQVDKAEAAGR